MFRSLSPLLCLLLLLSCEPTPEAPKAAQRDVLHTSVTISLFGNPNDSVYNDIFSQLDEIDALMSDYNPDSEVSHVSEWAGVKPVSVSPATLIVVHKALRESELTKGIFDPTIGPVTHLWDVGGVNPHVPDSSSIASALKFVSWKDVVVDDAAGTIFLRRKGMILDLGGIAKGYALDLALKTAREAGVTSGIFNMGNSSIGLLGKKPGDKPWKIGLQDPFQAPGTYFGIIEGSDLTVETSGPYQKFFKVGESRYHHIMDPRTGSPAQSGLEQVSLILPLDTQLADGLSTSCFILGLEAAMALVDSLPNAAAVLVGSDRKVYLSSRVGDRFQLTDTTFTVVRYPPSP